MQLIIYQYLNITFNYEYHTSMVHFITFILSRLGHHLILQLPRSVEVIKSFSDTLAHGLLTLTYPDTGVKELLVRLVSTLWVTNGTLDIVMLVLNKVTNTGQISVLGVCVDVDLDNTVANGLLVLILGGTRATVEDKEDGLVARGTELLLDVGLVLLKEFWVQTDIARLVDTVYITETSGDGEVRADGGKSVVNSQDILGLSVEGVVVNVLVVDTILLTTSDTDFLSYVSYEKEKKKKTARLTISSHFFIGAARFR